MLASRQQCLGEGRPPLDDRPKYHPYGRPSGALWAWDANADKRGNVHVTLLSLSLCDARAAQVDLPLNERMAAKIGGRAAAQLLSSADLITTFEGRAGRRVARVLRCAYIAHVRAPAIAMHGRGEPATSLEAPPPFGRLRFLVSAWIFG